MHHNMIHASLHVWYKYFLDQDRSKHILTDLYLEIAQDINENNIQDKQKIQHLTNVYLKVSIQKAFHSSFDP